MSYLPTEPPHSQQADDFACISRAIAEGLRPDPRRSLSEWAEAERIVAEGSVQGPWRNARAPFLAEIMDKLTLRHPCQRVTLVKSAQVGGSQIGLNFLGQVLAETPAAALVVLPSLDSMRMYNRDKLDRMIRTTPALASAVADITSRDGAGSTTTVKRGRREAQVELVNAGASKSLQSRTVRCVLFEEPTEYDRDVDGRGDPVEQAMARTIQFRKLGIKRFENSTPGIKGDPNKGGCRITAWFEEGSQADWHVPCPHCADRAPLTFDRLVWTKGKPATAALACLACGGLATERDKARMNAGGAWVHAKPELADIHASYRINILASPFTPLDSVAEEAEKAESDPSKLKTYTQQWKGEAWDEAYDLPKADILLERRSQWTPGRVPPNVVFLMGATDVQGDYLSWAVWGFDRHFGQWLIDTGVIEGDPALPHVWQAHDALLKRRWADAWGKPIGPDVWGVDSGYLTQRVYAYARQHAASTAPELRALDGRDGWRLPPLGTPKRVGIDWNGQRLGTVNLWPVGTWDLKSELASALRLTEQGPGPEGWPNGALRFNEIVDRTWLQELLSEHCIADPRTGVRSWKKVNTRNEAWDLAVYTRALARQATIGFTDTHWQALAASRQGPPEDVQTDLATFWAPDLKAQAEAAIARPPPAPIPPPAATMPPPPGIVLQPRSYW
jgi:phage terminase large subunit GpA-like protein